MKSFIALAALAAALPAAAFAQDATQAAPAPDATATAPYASGTATAPDASATMPAQDSMQSSGSTGGASAPDGSKAFGFVPYVGVTGGYIDYESDKTRYLEGPRNSPDGAVISGLAGVNLPLGPVFVGAEGNVAKGFHEIDWQYGVAGRFGIRAGDSGLIFGKVGYEWTNFDHHLDYRGKDHRRGVDYGVGVEVGPKDIGLGGLTNSAGPRLRLAVDTDNFKDAEPTAGVIFHF